MRDGLERMRAVPAKYPRSTRVVLFFSLMAFAVLPSILLSQASVLSRLEQSRAVFGEGDIIASGGSFFPDCAPGETVYATLNVRANWTGDIQYRIAMRASAPVYERSGECEEIWISVSPDNSTGSYKLLSGNCETHGWVVVRERIDWWEVNHKIHLRWEAGSPLSGGPHVFSWDVRVEPDVDLHEYAWEHCWDLLNLLPWLFSTTALLWVFVYAVVKLPPYLRE